MITTMTTPSDGPISGLKSSPLCSAAADGRLPRTSPANREALRAFLKPETTIWQYTHGVTDATAVSPDGYSLDNFYLSRPDAHDLQLDLFGDYKSNVALYPAFQKYSEPTSRRSSLCGAGMIRSSCRRVLRHSDATSPMRSCVSSILVISRSRRMLPRSRQ